MRSAKLLSLAAILIEPALADIHYFYLGYFSESYISLVEFDDSLNTLKLSNNVSITGGSSRWLAADVSLPIFHHLILKAQRYRVGGTHSLQVC